MGLCVAPGAPAPEGRLSVPQLHFYTFSLCFRTRKQLLPLPGCVMSSKIVQKLPSSTTWLPGGTF